MDRMKMTITGSEARALLNAAHDDGCPPECSGSCVGATLRLNAHGRDLAAAVIALEAERDRCLDGVNRLLDAQREDSARLVAERDAALREAVSRHDDAHRARQERDHARAEVEQLRRLSERRAEERHEQEVRAIRAERERHEAAVSRDEAVFAREAAVSQHRQDLLAIANALGCTDTDPASLVAAARIADERAEAMRLRTMVRELFRAEEALADAETDDTDDLASANREWTARAEVERLREALAAHARTGGAS